MFVSGFVIAGLGIYAALVGSIWLLTKAFSKGILWGLASLIIPPVVLIFALMNWGISWRPLALNVVGTLGAAGGAALLVMSVAKDAEAGFTQSFEQWEQQAGAIEEGNQGNETTDVSAP